ncbi:MAG: HPr kinase/phosphorylase [Spirochaetales bacterium]|nr:HPr kinase/phosphorylase [Spirochaetales bacterium]
MEAFTILHLLDLDLKDKDDLKLNCTCGRKGLNRKISVPNINRPGLPLTGFLENFAYERIQIFGKGEYAYVEKLISEGNTKNLDDFFSFEIPCCIVTSNIEPDKIFIEIAEKHNVPILKTNFDSSDFIIRLMRVLGDIFAPREVKHGTLVEVYGIGILIMGDSGVGKSETALELIERGHRLIADDAVELRCVDGSFVMGKGVNELTGHHMEIRGLGIININHLFGVGAIRDKKQVQLIVHLKEWDSEKNYDRFGGEVNTEKILGIPIPSLEIPVKPGRNIPIIVETAAMNERLKKMGYYSAKEFNENILNWLENENARNVYFQNRDKF